MNWDFFYIPDLLSKEVHVEPAFLSVFGKRDTAGDGFVVAFHVEVMADVGIILVFIRVAFTACHKSFFVFPHHLEVSIGNFDGRFLPRSAEVRARVLSAFAAITEMTVCFIRSEIGGGLVIGASLLFFGRKRQRFQVFGSSVFIDFIEASLTPILAEEGFFRRR